MRLLGMVECMCMYLHVLEYTRACSSILKIAVEQDDAYVGVVEYTQMHLSVTRCPEAYVVV